MKICIHRVVLLSALAIFNLTYVNRSESGEPPLVPSPQKPASVAQGTPQHQAAAFTDIVASADRNKRLAGWLGVYDAVGVPVIGQNGVPIGSTGDDPIGPRFWQLWYASGRDLPGRGIRMTDAGRLIAVGSPQQDGKDFGTILLKDLKQALQSNDPKVRFLGEFVRERVRRASSQTDLLDPDVTADSAMIDLPTVQLLGWLSLREALLRSIVPQERRRSHSGLGDFRIQPVAETTLNLRPAPQSPCAQVVGDPDIEYWINWFTREVAARGVDMPEGRRALPGVIERVQRWISPGLDTIDTTRKVGGLMNALTAAMSFVMQLAALELDLYQEPDPLERTKDTSHGKEATLFWRLSFPSPDGRTEDSAAWDLPNCFLSFATNALGLSLSLPRTGRIAGAEVRFYGGKGFPNLVLFGNYRDVFPKTSNEHGEGTISLLGRAQKKRLPESAKPVLKEFSVYAAAQPEAVDGNTIASIFFNGLLVGLSPDGVGAITPIIDILKTFHWRLGEYVLRLQDWQMPGFKLNPEQASWAVVIQNGRRGIVCSLEKPFAILNGEGIGRWETMYTPSNAKGGIARYTHVPLGLSHVYSGSGPYTIEEYPDPELDRSNYSVLWDGTFRSYDGPGSRQMMHHVLVPLDTDECVEERKISEREREEIRRLAPPGYRP